MTTQFSADDVCSNCGRAGSATSISLDETCWYCGQAAGGVRKDVLVGWRSYRRPIPSHRRKMLDPRGVPVWSQQALLRFPGALAGPNQTDEVG